MEFAPFGLFTTFSHSCCPWRRRQSLPPAAANCRSVANIAYQFCNSDAYFHLCPAKLWCASQYLKHNTCRFSYESPILPIKGVNHFQRGVSSYSSQALASPWDCQQLAGGKHLIKSSFKAALIGHLEPNTQQLDGFIPSLPCDLPFDSLWVDNWSSPLLGLAWSRSCVC